MVSATLRLALIPIGQGHQKLHDVVFLGIGQFQIAEFVMVDSLRDFGSLPGLAFEIARIVEVDDVLQRFEVAIDGT